MTYAAIPYTSLLILTFFCQKNAPRNKPRYLRSEKDHAGLSHAQTLLGKGRGSPFGSFIDLRRIRRMKTAETIAVELAIRSSWMVNLSWTIHL